MSATHDHSHAGHSHGIDPEAGDRRVALAIAVNLGLTAAQVAGGIVAGSTALIADAVHNFSDAISLVIAFWARKIARRPRDDAMTFGYGRAEIVAALVNYTSLILISLWLLGEGVMKLFAPEPVDGWIVVALAGIALVIDSVTALLTWKMSKDSLNIRAAFLHNLADALTSVAVIIAGTLILLYDWRLVDPIVTLLIAGYILWHGVIETGPVIRILMQGSPPATDTEAVRDALAGIPGVEAVHHLHLWQIDERRASVEAHVVVEDLALFPTICAAAKARLAELGIGHATLEPETRGSGCADD